MIVVTAIIPNKYYFADSLSEAEDLIDDALSGNFWQNMSQIYTSDRRAVDGCYPGHRFGIGTDRSGKLAAAHFVTNSDNGTVLQSLNPEPIAAPPEIVFDSEGGIFFPSNAVVSRAAVREAAMEYCRTSALPANLVWQPSYWC